jgi:hypothetical protein
VLAQFVLDFVFYRAVPNGVVQLWAQMEELIFCIAHRASKAQKGRMGLKTCSREPWSNVCPGKILQEEDYFLYYQLDRLISLVRGFDSLKETAL